MGTKKFFTDTNIYSESDVDTLSIKSKNRFYDDQIKIQKVSS